MGGVVKKIGGLVKKAVRAPLDMLGDVAGKLTGAGEIADAMRAEARRVLALQKEQEMEDEKARRLREHSLRGALVARPNLFDVLGSRQDQL